MPNVCDSVTVPIPCPSCRHNLLARPDWHGRQVRCPHCSTRVTLDFANPMPDPPRWGFKVEETIGWLTDRLADACSALAGVLWWSRYAWIGLIAAGYSATYFNSNLPYDGVFAYPWLAGAIWCLCEIARHKIPPSLFPCVRVITIMAALYLMGTQHIITNDRSTGTAEIREQRPFWSGKANWQHIEIVDGSTDISASGPLAGTGTRHGHWKFYTMHPEITSGDVFYWYGEEISEGQWHLRNR